MSAAACRRRGGRREPGGAGPAAARAVAATLAILAWAGLVAGCAGIGPVDVGPIGEPNFEQLARRSVDLGPEPVVLANRVEWYLGEDGWRPRNLRQAVVVLQETRLLVLGWVPRRQAYDRLLEIPYASARDVRRRAWPSPRIIVELKDGEIHAFTVTSNNGVGVSMPRTNRTIAALREKIPSSDAR
jgi:hypothetical protein